MLHLPEGNVTPVDCLQAFENVGKTSLAITMMYNSLLMAL